jgi:hypothetical protein
VTRVGRLVQTYIFPEFTVVARGGEMVRDSHSSRTYVQIRRMILIAHGMAFNIWEDNHSSRTYVRIRRMVLVAHCGAFSIYWDSHSSYVISNDQDSKNGPYITLLSE